MVCALLIVSGLSLFLAGMIAGAALLLMLDRGEAQRDEKPPVLLDP